MKTPGAFIKPPRRIITHKGTKWMVTNEIVEFIQPKRPDRRSFPSHGDVPVRRALLVDNNKYHPRTAHRYKETFKARLRAARLLEAA